MKMWNMTLYWRYKEPAMTPFLLALRGAKIYDLDENPVDIKRWTELENVRMYYEFFKKHNNEF
jgi:predicted ATPase